LGEVRPDITDKRAKAMVAGLPALGTQADYDANAWRTPPDLFERLNAQYGGFSIDLAASSDNALCPCFYTREDDGLAQSWANEVGWCNPPYDDIASWVHKAVTSSVHDDALTVMLLPVRSDSEWWRDLVIPFATVEFLPRVTFGPPLGYAGPRGNAVERHAIVVFGYGIVPEFVTVGGEEISFKDALNDGRLEEQIVSWRSEADELLLWPVPQKRGDGSPCRRSDRGEISPPDAAIAMAL
jgi:phage N-6-adenine-methyltransferase